MTSPSQPYAYVFEPPYPKTPWLKLEDSEPLSQLYAKYWGRPIQGDEPELQTPSEGQPMEDHEDKSEVGPGCFILNLGIKPFSITRLWIRRDYIRLYERCNEHDNDVRESELQLEGAPRIAPSVVITGQPGIGEYFSSSRHPILNHPFMNREKLLDLLCHPPTPR